MARGKDRSSDENRERSRGRAQQRRDQAKDVVSQQTCSVCQQVIIPHESGAESGHRAGCVNDPANID